MIKLTETQSDWLHESARFDWFISHISAGQTGGINIQLTTDLKKTFRKLDQAAKWLTETNATWLMKNTKWYASFISDVVPDDGDATAVMSTLLTETLSAKREKAEQIRRDAPDLPLRNSEYSKIMIIPESEHNEMDKLFLQDVVYCDENEQFYTVTDDSYTRLGGEDFMRTDSNTAQSFIAVQKVKLHKAIYKSEGSFELWKHIKAVERIATETFFEFRDKLAEAKQTENYGSSKVNFMGDEYLSLKDFESKNHLYSPRDEDDWVSRLSSVVLKHVINKDLPATLVSRNLLQIKAANDGSLGIFSNFVFMPPTKQCTLREFYIELFDTGVKGIVPHITNIPHICSDTHMPAKYHLKSDWMNNLVDQKPYEECKAIQAFLAPYSEDEKKMLMSWAYSVFHPSVKNNIGLLIKTGGGSFKTNVYARLISDVVYNMYGDASFTVVGDKWVKNEQFCETSTKGFSTSEFIFNDECTEGCIVKYKDMSGSTYDAGVSYSFKKVYQVPVNTKIFAKFLFCTNTPFTIADAQGVYDRRLAIIDRMDIKKLEYPYPPQVFDDEIKREIKAFYELSKASYEHVKAEYGTIENFARTSSINKNLKAVYNEDAKKFAYDQLLKELRELDGSDNVQILSPHGKEQYNVTNKVIRELTEKIAPDMDLNPKGFKKFLLEVDTELQNKGPDQVKISGNGKYGYILHNRK